MKRVSDKTVQAKVRCGDCANCQPSYEHVSFEGRPLIGMCGISKEGMLMWSCRECGLFRSLSDNSFTRTEY